MSDVELVARARKGDAGAFGELVDRHRAAVYRAALAALGSPEDAEDTAQDAFVSAYRRLASFRGDASFKTWLLTIAWNHAINRRRGLRRWWRPSGGGASRACEDLDQLSSGARSPEQAAADHQLRRAIALVLTVRNQDGGSPWSTTSPRSEPCRRN